MNALIRPTGWVAPLLLLLALLLLGCSPVVARSAATAPDSGQASGSSQDKPIELGLLKVEPVTGHVGEPFTIAADGLSAGARVEFQWATREGAYATKAVAHDVQFLERRFAETRISLGQAVADAQGRATTAFTIPEDYGEIHDIYAVVDGKEVAKGGFRVFRNATISPTEGPVGTPITIVVKGLGWKPFESTMSIRYDNKYTGFVSAVTTKGTAVFQIRAAGPVGRHTIQLTAASPGVPFLNVQQSGTAHIPNMDLQFTFTVTEDAGLPPDTLDWPDESRVAKLTGPIPGTTVAPGVTAVLDSTSGPTLSKTTLRASGLKPNAPVALSWLTGRGSDAQEVRYLAEMPLLETKAGRDGSLTTSFQITDDRGGWQVVKVAQGDKVMAEIPYFVERNLVSVSPRQVKAGEPFTVRIKGGGWTEIDKGVAVVYDNAYIGYACAVTSSGDITLNLVATGEPGTHLIDLYPMIYRHKGDHPAEFWNFQLPQLTALRDHPGLDLGYKLPIFRLAIEVVE